MTICHVCQTPTGGEPERTTAGEPAHDECLEEPDITPGDVEAAREAVLDGLPEDASEEARSVAIDAVIAFDRRLTDPETFRNDGH